MKLGVSAYALESMDLGVAGLLCSAYKQVKEAQPWDAGANLTPESRFQLLNFDVSRESELLQTGKYNSRTQLGHCYRTSAHLSH